MVVIKPLTPNNLSWHFMKAGRIVAYLGLKLTFKFVFRCSISIAERLFRCIFTNHWLANIIVLVELYQLTGIFAKQLINNYILN